MKKEILLGAVCLLGNLVSATVIDLEKLQAENSSIVYQYTFEGTTASERLDQKVGSNKPDMTAFKTPSPANTVSFEAGYDSSSTAAKVHAGTIALGKRNTGAALKTVANVTIPESGTIEYMVKASILNDAGFAVAGKGDGGANSRWYFFYNGGVSTDKASMTLGANVGYDLIGGTAAVAYKADCWYYVVQTWSLSGGVVTMNAWVADMSLETPVLTQTVTDKASAHTGETSTLLRLGSNGDVNNFFRGEVDAVAIYNTVLDAAAIQSHFGAIKGL